MAAREEIKVKNEPAGDENHENLVDKDEIEFITIDSDSDMDSGLPSPKPPSRQIELVELSSDSEVEIEVQVEVKGIFPYRIFGPPTHPPPPLQNPTKLHIAIYTLGTSIERFKIRQNSNSNARTV